MTKSGCRILVVDDEANMRRVLEIMLQRMGHQVAAANDGHAAFELLRNESFDLVISDLRMPGLDGAGLLDALRASGNATPVIVVTAHGTVESAVNAIRQGASDYILRPFDIDALQLAIDRVLTTGQIQQQNAFLRTELEKPWSGLLGNSAAMRDVHEQIERVAATKTTVLITGETGTGKELVAHAIHRASPRQGQLFVAINCAAIPAEILESELFGHEKGAFTGALRDRVGKFELAEGGTLFLDELAEMPMALQPKLLRALQENVIERLGGNRPIPLDIRIIAATNRDPKRAIQDGRLREDLYYRLNVFNITLPPLRSRREDIPPLVRHFIDEFARSGLGVRTVTPSALERLARYDWPGNVRELRNVIERALVLARGAQLDAGDFPVDPPQASKAASMDVGDEGLDLDLEKAVGITERRLIAESLRRTGGNKTRAAMLLKISGRSLWYKLKQLGLERDEDEPVR